MSVKSSSIYAGPVPKMPPGLVELMEGLAKDVLKCNPPEVYAFCADHMKRLLEIRDGAPSQQVMTLEQKVAVAIKKTRERAARRREDYDKTMQMSKELESEINKSEEVRNKYNSEPTQNGNDNIVNISDIDLMHNTELEINADCKENLFENEPQHVDILYTKIESAEKDSVSIELPDSLQQSDKTNHDKEISVLNVNNDDDNKVNKEMQENLPNENIKCQVDDNKVGVVSAEEDGLELFENKNNSDYQTSAVPLDINKDDLKKNENEENNQEHNVNKAIEKNIFVVVDEPKNYNVFGENKQLFDDNTEETSNVDENKEILDYNTKETSNMNKNKEKFNISYEEQSHDIDKIPFNSLIITEDIKDNRDQVYKHFEAQHDNNLLTTPSALLEEDEFLNSDKFESENHQNNTTMDLETAAITIQKVFRNFLFKNKTLSSEDATNVDINSLIEDKVEMDVNDISSMHINKDRRTLGLSRMDTVLQTVNEEKSLSQSTDDSSTLSSAATIIQAHVRGYLTRNKLNINKNSSTTSGVDSDGLSFASLEGDNDNRKNKTVLNIHIVPENGNFLSRDESVLTSIDLSMDGSPPSSTNLHPLGYDRSERRKQLKREDAFQSTSPPSNNSGKLSEDVDSVKEMLITDHSSKIDTENERDAKDFVKNMFDDVNISTMVDCLDTALEVKSLGPFESPEKHVTDRPHSLPDLTTDEMDVITPFNPLDAKFFTNSHLMHSGEFHDVVLPTQVSRSDDAVVRGE